MEKRTVTVYVIFKSNDRVVFDMSFENQKQLFSNLCVLVDIDEVDNITIEFNF